jgi:hypothetical protein
LNAAGVFAPKLNLDASIDLVVSMDGSGGESGFVEREDGPSAAICDLFGFLWVGLYGLESVVWFNLGWTPVFAKNGKAGLVPNRLHYRQTTGSDEAVTGRH